MPTTTNFGWTTPADTDLVKDGASAMRTLAGGIDTSMAQLKGGTTGQILSKTNGTDMAFTWINNDQGDITAVTAGTGISGGGTSGAVTITNSMATEITAAGDIIVGTGSGTFDNLPIGTTGQILTADTTVSPYKVKWATASSGSSFVGASAYRHTTLSLTADTAVIVTYVNESYDTSGFHDTSTNTSRMTVPSGKAGKYLCIANYFATGGSSRFILYPYKNGANAGGSPYWSYVIDNRGFGNAGANTGVWVMDLAVGDYVEVALYSATSTATLQESTFQFIYLGA